MRWIPPAHGGFKNAGALRDVRREQHCAGGRRSEPSRGRRLGQRGIAPECKVGPQRSRDIARDTCALRQYDIDAVCITFGCQDKKKHTNINFLAARDL